MLILLCTFMVLFRCSKSEAVTSLDVQNFTDTSFEMYPDFNIDYDNLDVLENGMIAIAGSKNTSSKQILIIVDPNKKDTLFSVINEDPVTIFRPIHLLPTQNGNLIYLSHTPKEAGAFDMDINIVKLNSNGSVIWRSKIAESNENEISNSITQIPNGDFFILGSNSFLDSEYKDFKIYRISNDGELIFSKPIFQNLKLTSTNNLKYLPNDNSILILSTDKMESLTKRKLQITKFDLEGNEIASSSIFENIEFELSPDGVKVLKDGSLLIFYSIKNDSPSSTYSMGIARLILTLK
ncbi:MAG: hypothetical protein ACJA1A_002858 [Saprospiraceae bacterium]|jgi:hypothetical protein